MNATRNNTVLRIFNLWWLQVLLFSSGSFAQANQDCFQHLTIENGLSNNSVNSIVQDEQGYIWIATENGLNRFNGYTSKVFYPDNQDSCEELRTQVNCSFRDSRGRLWFGANGLVLCIPKSESFTVFRFDANNQNSIINNDIFKIVEDEFATIWIATRNGLVRYNESTMDFTKFRHDTAGGSLQVYSRNRIIDMISDRKGNLWLTTHMGLYQFSLADHSFHSHLLQPALKDSRMANQSRQLAIDNHGKIWIHYYGKGVYHFDINSKQYAKINFPKSEMNEAVLRISSIICDTKNNIWIASEFDGVLFYNTEKATWNHYKHDIFNPNSLAENNTLCLYEDYSGLMWIGTRSKGVDRVNSGHQKFMNFILQPGKPNALCESDITCFREDHKGNVWIGSRSGLMFFDRSTNGFTCFKHDKKNPNSISDNLVYCIDIDSLHNLWIGTENGLNYFNPATNRWINFYDREDDLNGLPGRQTFDVKARRNGEVWIATSNLICRFEPKSKTFINRNNNATIDALPHAFYVTLYEDAENTMWLSTARSGVYVVDNEFQLIRSYRKSGGFQANVVRQFNEDPSGTLWMATDQGIYYKLKQTTEILKLRSSTAILNGDIKSIIPESDSKLWVSTLSGLVFLSLDPQKNIESLRIFTEKDGLQSKAFNTFAGLMLRSGEFCFGGINGFNIFNPSSIQYNSYSPQVRITSFKVQHRELPFSMYAANHSTLYFDYDQNDFSFEMAALSYDIIENNQYGYQLTGYDQDINYCGSNRFVQYSNVPPGKYRLQILGSNNDGVWNTDGQQLNIVIHPPFWQTLWFRMFAVLFALVSGFVMYSRRIKAIRKQEKEKATIVKQIAEARSVALRAQMNPHFIFNSLNSIQQLISESDKQDAQKYLSKFSRLMRLVLENSGRNLNTVASEKEILELYLELETLRFENKFTYKIELGDDPSILNVEIPSLILHPFVENAVIHGLLNKPEPGLLQITMLKKNDSLVCCIEDNGIGRKASESIKLNKSIAHQSLGVQVTEDRIKMIETITNKKARIMIEDLVDSNQRAAGTRVVIEIPIESEV